MPEQVEMYKKFMTTKAVKQMLNGTSTSQPLKMVTLLKKLCNHPALLEEKDLADVRNIFPSNFNPKAVQTEFSSKFVGVPSRTPLSIRSDVSACSSSWKR